MVTISLSELNSVGKLAETGRHGAVIEELERKPADELEGSATLALLYGTALARLGKLGEGGRWIEIALARARDRADRTIEARALNARGIVALEAGRIDEAAESFMAALEEAERDGNHATVGRCSNNLGIIAHLQGTYDRAVGRYTLALAAFQNAGLDRGLAETQHNLGMTYREQGQHLHALKAADRAVQQASAVGDQGLYAATLAGRAEIRLAAGDVHVAMREVARALELHRALGDVVGESEDLRVQAACHAALEAVEEAEAGLRRVIERAEGHGRLALAAAAERDLARVCVRRGHADEAVDLARRARTRYQRLGAAAEVERLDRFLETLIPVRR